MQNNSSINVTPLSQHTVRRQKYAYKQLNLTPEGYQTIHDYCKPKGFIISRWVEAVILGLIKNSEQESQLRGKVVHPIAPSI